MDIFHIALIVMLASMSYYIAVNNTATSKYKSALNDYVNDINTELDDQYRIVSEFAYKLLEVNISDDTVAVLQDDSFVYFVFQQDGVAFSVLKESGGIHVIDIAYVPRWGKNETH